MNRPLGRFFLHAWKEYRARERASTDYRIVRVGGVGVIGGEFGPDRPECHARFGMRRVRHRRGSGAVAHDVVYARPGHRRASVFVFHGPIPS